MMNTKSAVRWLLLLIVFGSLGFYGVQKWRTPAAGPAAAVLAPAEKAAAVIVTYFTTDVRCPSCLTIEDLSRKAILAGFAEEVASGKVLFRVLNTDRPENKHFLERYAITNKTVIVSHRQEGVESDWINRQDVWLLFNDPDAFFAYLREPVRRYLGKS